MRPLLVVILQEFADQKIQMFLAEGDELVEALLLNGLHETLDAPQRPQNQLAAGNVGKGQVIRSGTTLTRSDGCPGENEGLN